jgi:hypothetical protein
MQSKLCDTAMPDAGPHKREQQTLKLQPTIGYEVFTGDHSMKWSTRRTVETVAKPSSGEKNGHCGTMHVGFLLGIPTICRSSVLPPFATATQKERCVA